MWRRYQWPPSVKQIALNLVPLRKASRSQKYPSTASSDPLSAVLIENLLGGWAGISGAIFATDLSQILKPFGHVHWSFFSASPSRPHAGEEGLGLPPHFEDTILALAGEFYQPG